jgi:hypothetical protein
VKTVPLSANVSVPMYRRLFELVLVVLTVGVAVAALLLDVVAVGVRAAVSGAPGEAPPHAARMTATIADNIAAAARTPSNDRRARLEMPSPVQPGSLTRGMVADRRCKSRVLLSIAMHHG